MGRVRRLALAQRVVIVVGLGVLVAYVGYYVMTDGFRAASGTWYAYAPDSSSVYVSVGHPNRTRLLVEPVALIVVWTAVSAWLVGGRSSNDD